VIDLNGLHLQEMQSPEETNDKEILTEQKSQLNEVADETHKAKEECRVEVCSLCWSSHAAFNSFRRNYRANPLAFHSKTRIRLE